MGEHINDVIDDLKLSIKDNGPSERYTLIDEEDGSETFLPKLKEYLNKEDLYDILRDQFNAKIYTSACVYFGQTLRFATATFKYKYDADAALEWINSLIIAYKLDANNIG